MILLNIQDLPYTYRPADLLLIPYVLMLPLPILPTTSRIPPQLTHTHTHRGALGSNLGQRGCPPSSPYLTHTLIKFYGGAPPAIRPSPSPSGSEALQANSLHASRRLASRSSRPDG